MKLYSYCKKKNGFTLVELILASSISLSTILIGYYVLKNIIEGNKIDEVQFGLNAKVNDALDFIIDEVDGTDNISQFGYSGGAAQKGELVVQGLSTICTPVLINSISATIMHVAVEGSPTAARLLAAIQPMLTGNGANATVTAGEYRVV